MADDNIQDVSGIPANDLMAQMELQRRLKIAQELQKTTAPESQMVSGHYVAPSWTQYAANALNKYMGSKAEKEALGQYGEYQKTRQSQLGDILAGLKEHTQETPLDTTQTGGAPGMWDTQTIKPDINKTIQQMSAYDPNFGTKIIETNIAKQLTPKEPMKIGAGEVLLDPNTMKPLYTAPNKPAVEKTPQIKQLLDIQKTLDPKSADYKIISDAIKHETTFAPNAMTIMPNASQVDNAAQMIANGQIAPLSGFAMRSPYGQAVMSKVKELNPEYSGATFSNVKQAQQKFNVGKQGDTVRSLNVAVNHLDTAKELANALNNNDIPVFNKASNALSQATGSPTVTNFDSAKGIIADEVAKGVLGNGAGSLADRIEFADKIRNSNSPAQLAGTIDTWQKLLAGQLGGLKQQYTSSGGTENDFNKKISSRTQQVLGSIISSHTPQSTQSSARSKADAILGGK